MSPNPILPTETPVLITGGTGDLGRGLVVDFLTRGHPVAFTYVRNSRQAEDLRTLGAVPYCVDFRVSGWQEKLPQGPISILINNAAINISRATSEAVESFQWSQTMDVNLNAPFATIQHYLSGMKEKKFGRIINISSIYGLRSAEGNLPYTVSKHALSGLTKTLAREYGAFGITSNEVCPGPIDSSLLNRIAVENARIDGTSSKTQIDELIENIPCRRLATVADVVAVVTFLASEGAGYVNGASIVVDGGLTA